MCSFERVRGAIQLYVLMNAYGVIVMFLAKVTDDMLMEGTPTTMGDIGKNGNNNSY